jgi:hypothetical protein
MASFCVPLPSTFEEIERERERRSRSRESQGYKEEINTIVIERLKNPSSVVFVIFSAYSRIAASRAIIETSAS